MKNLLILFVVLLFACQPGGGPITQADKDAINLNIAGFADGVNKNAVAGDGYADDIISMPPNVKENTGKESVLTFHNDPNGPKNVTFTLATAEVEGNGDLAYARGTWTFKGTVMDTVEVNDNGKFLVILKKQADGSWKTAREIWNSDLPVPGQ